MVHRNLRCWHGTVFFPLVATVCAFFAPAFACAQAPAAPPPIATDAARPASSDSLSIGPGLFTFPQIAALLSTPQTPVACDPALNDRAAYVFLQSRPRAQAKYILGAGLQVEFVLDDKTQTVTMVRQKAVAEREAQWLKRLARVLQTRWRAELQKTLARSGQPFVDTDRRARLAQEVSRLGAEVGDPPYDTPPATDVIARQRAQVVKHVALLNEEYKLPSAQERMLADWAQTNPPDFVSLLQGKTADFAAQSVAPQWIEHDWLAQTFREGLRQYIGKPIDTLPSGYTAQDYRWLPSYDFVWGPLLTIEFLAHGNLVHQPSEASYAAYKAAVAWQFDKTKPPSDAEKQNANIVHFLNGTLRAQIGFGLPNDADTVPERIPAPLFALGQEAVDWWEKEQEDTDRCLQTLPDTLLAPAASVQLPDPKAGREIVMELHPRAELWQESGGASKTAPALTSWVHPIQGTDQWSVREKENVLLITNRLAFLNRPQNAPLTEWLQFAGAVRQWREKNEAVLDARYGTGTPDHRFIDDFIPYEPLANYTRAVTTRRDGRTWRLLGNLSGSNYHGTDLSALDAAVPAVFIWNTLPEKERLQLFARLETPTPNAYERFNKGRLSLSQFSDTTLITLARLLRERGMMDADPQNQNAIDYLRSCAFYVELYTNPKENLPGYRSIQVSIQSDTDRVVPDRFSSARFLITAPSTVKSNP